MAFSRKQFLKALGLGALASAVPVKWGVASPKMEEARTGAKRMRSGTSISIISVSSSTSRSRSPSGR